MPNASPPAVVNLIRSCFKMSMTS